MTAEQLPLFRIMGLHALSYCERLFYLEEVEEIRRADDRIYAGRRVHLQDVNEGIESLTYELESETWGIRGKVDAVRYRDGSLVAFEHKKGRSKSKEAWPWDRLQIIAYCALLEDATGKRIPEGRIRYHQDKTTVRIPFDDEARLELKTAIGRAQALRIQGERPPVTTNSRACTHCSLAPVCLPEEERFVDEQQEHRPRRLFPENDDRRILHLTEPGTYVERSAEQLIAQLPDGRKVAFPGRDIAALVLHGPIQLTTQALHYCAIQEIGVHWLTGGGSYVGSLAAGVPGVQRRHRQYRALSEPSFCLQLAIRVAHAKVENQLRYILRATRPSSGKEDERPAELETLIIRIRSAISHLTRATSVDELRGYEGQAGHAYFEALNFLIQPEAFKMKGRNRRPPLDPTNALLSFGYALLYKECVAALLTVGLESAFGFYHTPRSAAQPLALDLMEIFRVLLVDLPVMASINRKQWELREDFAVTPHKVWLNEDGRKKFLTLFENRKQETWKHPVLNYSLSYARTIELEARLLEKEWAEQPGLFAKLRLR